MKKRNLILLLVIALILTGCGNKYKGYWCNYNETATIIVLLKDNNTSEQRSKIEANIEQLDNVESSNYYSKEDYAEELGEDVDSMDIHANYFITFSSMDNISDYVEALNKLDGVLEARQSNAKSNISLYNLKGWGKYTFTNSDEASEKDVEKGSYSIRKGVITFRPSSKDAKEKILYIKDGYLCGDAACTEIYAHSTETCSSK